MYSVYLVDDDTLILEELINMVPWLDNGFEVVGSQTNPETALEEIQFIKPDVVFCDLKMPEMDGNELIKALKEANADSEFVMISAYDSFENVRAFFQQSGFDYILKPVNNEDIQNRAGVGSYDIVVANILAEVLTAITPVVPLMLKDGGVYITSGILNEKENIVIEAMEKEGLTVLDVSRQGEWSSIVARK